MIYIPDRSILRDIISKDKDIYIVKDTIYHIIDGLKRRITD